jgi:plasmid stability protein
MGFMTIYLEVDLKRALRIEAATKEQSLSELVRDILMSHREAQGDA